MESLNEIIKGITRKRELRDLDDSFVKNLVTELGKKYKDGELFKEARRILRLVYGMYKVKLKGNLLQKHPSTKERFPYYKEIYKKIFSLTGKPKIILDLGCGLNPLSYNFLDCRPEYYACDIGQEYIDVINNYFKKNDVKGNAFIFNLISGDYNKLPKADVCFLFKVLESLELVKKNISKDVLNRINCKYIIVSFSKKALGGKTIIRKKGRKWFRRILNELNYKYETLDIGNEIFFVIRKV